MVRRPSGPTSTAIAPVGSCAQVARTSTPRDSRSATSLRPVSSSPTRVTSLTGSPSAPIQAQKFAAWPPPPMLIVAGESSSGSSRPSGTIAMSSTRSPMETIKTLPTVPQLRYPEFMQLRVAASTGGGDDSISRGVGHPAWLSGGEPCAVGAWPSPLRDLSAASNRALMRGRESGAMSAIAFPRAVPAPTLDVIWTRASFAVLMVVTFVLYLWGLDRNGWANAYYAAAVEAGATSWKAFFFGSLDASNFITVDKSTAFLWVMEISARLFGFNEWSVLVPQALEGVATVGIVFVAVRRWFGSAAGLIAGAVVALTPVAALMFRYNNPDALLVLLLTAAAYATLRAVESGSTRWLVLAAALIGTGFLAKMLQAFVVVPVVVLVYLALGRPRLLPRIKQLVIAGFTLVLASGWWVAVVELWPSADRPYIGGSQNNSLLNLIFGYNGFGRITGNEAGSVGGLGAVGSRWGLTGWERLFLSEFGGQISWLIPGALILMAAGLWITLRAKRTDLARASYLMWGGFLVVTGAVFSFAQGIIHPYYAIALAPAIGGLVGAGTAELWKRRANLVARIFLAAALTSTVVWAYVLLDRTPDWNPGLKVAILIGGLIASAMIVAGPLARRPLAVTVAAVALFAAFAGPAAYTLETVTA